MAAAVYDDEGIGGDGEVVHERNVKVLRAYNERTFLRGLTRIFGVSRNSVTRWLKKS
jgi:hypothetical protein